MYLVQHLLQNKLVPKWTRLVKGTANQVLTMDGSATDIVWAAAAGADNLGDHTATENLVMANFDITALDDIFFNATNTEITQASGIMSIRVGSSDTIRLRRGTTSGFIYDANGFKFGTSLNIGVFGTTPVAKQTVTGSRGGNAALASLLTAMANFGWITDSTT